MTVYADVKTLAEAGESVVTMTIAVPVAFVTPLPDATCEMVERQFMFVVVDDMPAANFVLALDEFEPECQ